MNEINVLYKIKDDFVIQQMGDLGDGLQELGDPYQVTQSKAILIPDMPAEVEYLGEISDTVVNTVKDIADDYACIENGNPPEHFSKDALKKLSKTVFGQLETIEQNLKKDSSLEEEEDLSL